MTELIKRMIGFMLISSPFIAICVVVVYIEGLKHGIIRLFIVYSVCLCIFVVVFLGVKLAFQF